MRLFAIALALSGCVLPLKPDRAELARFVDGKPGAPVEVTPLLMGVETHAACGMVGADSCFKRLEMVHTAYLVKHPKGTFLVDAGLSARIGDDLARFSFSTRIAFGFARKASIAQLLDGRKVDFVLPTHAHWDHTSGLVELPGARVLLAADEQAYLRDFHGDEPVVVRDHFRDVTVETLPWDGPPYENFPSSHDLFGDGAVVAVPLPGHTPGAIAVFLNDVRGRRLLLVGDAVWSRDGIRLPSHRPKSMTRLADADPALVSDAIWRLRHLQERHPTLLIVPAHDGEAYREVESLVARRR